MNARMFALIGAMTMASAAAAQEFQPKRFHLTVPIVEDGRPLAAIVAPETDDYRALVRRVQAALRQASGAELPVVRPEQAMPEAWTEGHSFILLGRLGDSAAVDALYRNHYVCADARWPGAGGHELRTVHDPWGTGASAVFLGGSTIEDIGRAADRFIELLPAGRDIGLPHTIDVSGPLVGPSMTEAGMEAIRRELPGSNFRSVGARASAGCLAYYRTGDPNHAVIAKEAMYRLAEIVAGMEEVGDSRGVEYLPLLFDLVEECDAWTDADRAALSRFLYEFATKLSYLRMDIEPSPTPRGNNWNIRTAWEAARYFAKYYGIDVNGKAARNLTNYYDAMMTWKSREDCPGYGSITVIDILHYVLKKPDFAAYFDSGIARRMADYAMTITSNMGDLGGFGDISALYGSANFPDPMSILAWYYRDGRYVWIREKMRGEANGSEFLGQAYHVADIEPVEPTDLLGVHVLPLEDWIWDYRDDMLATGVSTTDAILRAGEDPARERCFDKISFRDSFDAMDQYLLLGGQSHGYHSHPDGNAIIGFTDDERLWIFDSGYFVPDTTEHNTVAVYRDGLFEPVPRLTGLDASADLPAVGMTETSVRAYNGMDWSRGIIWAKERYFLVVDRLTAREAGDYGLQCIFRVIGEPAIEADRVLVTQQGKRMALMTDGAPSWEVRGVTPEAAGRYGLFENQNAELDAGDSLSFLNLFYCPEGEEPFPVQIARAADGAALISGPDGIACAGTGALNQPLLPVIDAALYHVSPTAISLCDGRSLAWPAEALLFAADAPVDLALDLRAGTGVIATDAPTTVRLAQALVPELTIDGGPTGAVADGMISVELAAGEHELRFTAGGGVEHDLADAWARAEQRKREGMRARAGAEGPVGEAVFAGRFTREETRDIWVEAATGEELRNLVTLGAAMAWTEAQAGCSPRNAADGNLETYSAVGTGAAHSDDLPKDLGVEWSEPQTVSQAWYFHYSAQYQPADDGYQIQYWDGEDWVAVDDTLEKRDEDATWVHSFAPVTTTRLRLFVTAFNTSRTAVREMAFFERPAEMAQRTETLAEPVRALITANLIGTEAAETIACVGGEVLAMNAGGEVLWRRPVGTSYGKCLAAFDLDADGRTEVLVGGQDRRVHCFGADGEELWVADCPADPYAPEIEPASGTVDVIAAGDIDGDGLGEVVFGASNWFAYALDHEGNLVWKALNFAHPPLDIALHDVTGDGRLSALIATRYNTANLFDADGRRIDAVSAGYHGIPMSVAMGDVDGNGAVELVTGSRIGGVHLKEHGGERAWNLNLGSQVTDVAVADLTGGGMPSVLACSTNHYLVCADAEGALTWRRNVGGAARQMAIADVNGDGALEIVVAVAGEVPAIVAANGDLLGRVGPPDAQWIAIADVDGDGRPELVAAKDGLVAAYRF
ncbi:MAG: hypothetical protein AB7Y46_13755 [Armatimonadota bacterium]